MKKPSRHELRLAAHALRWAQFGYRKSAEQIMVGNVRRWLLEQAGHERRPHLIGEHAFLYAINTSEFYDTHMAAAATALPNKRWRQWVRHHVLYRYQQENDQVWLMPVEVCRAARSLKRYYESRIREAANANAWPQPAKRKPML